MTKREVLKQARDLLSDKRKWGKGALYRDGAYCAAGALQSVTGVLGAFDEQGHREYVGALNALERTVGPVALYNDDRSTTHECILAAFDETIAQCDEQGAANVSS